ncbi:hypothetical protein [Roseovarius sp. D22-M7]|uniref:hypothetical protein n=1 Tax=Roseovarius sp. D22-M7 TaxID=3127116 RepID=UPI00301044C9
MTMFSIKPDFDLAEFLASPAPVGSARARNARRRKMPTQPAGTAEESPQPSPPKAAKSSETPDK